MNIQIFNQFHESGLSYEELGKLVRDTWVAWAKRQDNPKLRWLDSWEEMKVTQPQNVEVDIEIGIAVADKVLGNINKWNFLDTKFIEDGKTIDLISIGIVADNDKELYLINKDEN